MDRDSQVGRQRDGPNDVGSRGFGPVHRCVGGPDLGRHGVAGPERRVDRGLRGVPQSAAVRCGGACAGKRGGDAPERHRRSGPLGPSTSRQHCRRRGPATRRRPGTDLQIPGRSRPSRERTPRVASGAARTRPDQAGIGQAGAVNRPVGVTAARPGRAGKVRPGKGEQPDRENRPERKKADHSTE